MLVVCEWRNCLPDTSILNMAKEDVRSFGQVWTELGDGQVVLLNGMTGEIRWNQFDRNSTLQGKYHRLIGLSHQDVVHIEKKSRSRIEYSDPSCQHVCLVALQIRVNFRCLDSVPDVICYAEVAA